jgi:hypothetical protein
MTGETFRKYFEHFLGAPRKLTLASGYEDFAVASLWYHQEDFSSTRRDKQEKI